jgi:hypothetical protein
VQTCEAAAHLAGTNEANRPLNLLRAFAVSHAAVLIAHKTQGEADSQTAAKAIGGSQEDHGNANGTP